MDGIDTAGSQIGPRVNWTSIYHAVGPLLFRLDGSRSPNYLSPWNSISKENMQAELTRS